MTPCGYRALPGCLPAILAMPRRGRVPIAGDVPIYVVNPEGALVASDVPGCPATGRQSNPGCELSGTEETFSQVGDDVALLLRVETLRRVPFF